MIHKSAYGQLRDQDASEDKGSGDVVSLNLESQFLESRLK
jgi:hypothetical protein